MYLKRKQANRTKVRIEFPLWPKTQCVEIIIQRKIMHHPSFLMEK